MVDKNNKKNNLNVEKYKLYEQCKRLLVMEPMHPSEYQKRIKKLAEALGIQ